MNVSGRSGERMEGKWKKMKIKKKRLKEMKRWRRRKHQHADQEAQTVSWLRERMIAS